MLAARPRSHPLLTWKTPAIALLGLSLVLGGYFCYLYVELKQRFESRRWSIPSRVFSATVPLYPGQQLSISHLRQLLEERRYQEAIKEPLQAGEYKVGRDTVTVFLREFQFPGRALPAQRVEFAFQQSTLMRVKAGQTQIAFLELEPLEIARLFGADRKSRLLINIHQVPVHLINAVLAIEDHRFYEHRGVDWWGMLRALYTDLTAGRVVQGGSTITQQLVKNYFLEPSRTVRRKLQEAAMAVVLEAIYEKQAILEMYMNEIYMGQRGGVAVHGMGEAARYYFGRNVEDLTLSECATLAGIIRAPNHYSPLRSTPAALDRRNLVLKRMRDLEMIPALEYDQARGEPVRVAAARLPGNVAPYFVDYVQEQLHELYDEKMLGSEGLTIYTALHPEIGLMADRVLKEELDWLEREISDQNGTYAPGSLQAALLAVQPKTGSILALVGGRDYSTDPLNRVVTRRPAGSAIMPLVYLSALDQFTPASWLEDEPVSYTDQGTARIPKNLDDRYRGPVMLRDALAQSLNAATVALAAQVGGEKIAATVHHFGMEELPKSPFALALGDFPVTVLGLAGAYSALDNDGQKPYLLGVKEVVTERGEVQQRRHIEFVSATTPAKSYVITNLIREGAKEAGARHRGKLDVDFPFAGQAGMSPEARDGWFVGYTTDLLVVVWVGYDDNRPLPAWVSRGATRIWLSFMDQVRPWVQPQEFPVPPGIVQRLICVESGQLATTHCREKRLEVFLEQRFPKEYCSLHN